MGLVQEVAHKPITGHRKTGRQNKLVLAGNLSQYHLAKDTYLPQTRELFNTFNLRQ